MPTARGRIPTLVFVQRFVDAVVTEPLADMIAGRLRVPQTPASWFVPATDRRRPAA
jgi:hypothetical protein